MNELYKSLASESNHDVLKPSSLIEILTNGIDQISGQNKPMTYSTLYSKIIGANNVDNSFVPNSDYHAQKCNFDDKSDDMSDDMKHCDKSESFSSYIPNDTYNLPKLLDSIKNSCPNQLDDTYIEPIGCSSNTYQSSINTSIGKQSSLDNNIGKGVLLNVNCQIVNSSSTSFIEHSNSMNSIKVLPKSSSLGVELKSSDHFNVVDDVQDDDCDSNQSDDSDYMIKTSKFSKFLCVGVGRSKSKNSKHSKNHNSDSKKNAKMKNNSKSRTDISINNRSPQSPSEMNSKSTMGSQFQSSQKFPQNSSSYSNQSNQPWTTMNSQNFGDSQHWPAKCHSNYSIQSHTNSPISSRDNHPIPSINVCWNNTSEEIKCPDNKKLPVKPSPPSKSMTNNSVGTAVSMGESSGYGSLARDSECASSFSSSQDSEMDDDQRRENQANQFKSENQLKPSVQLMLFDEEDIQRYENRFVFGTSKIYLYDIFNYDYLPHQWLLITLKTFLFVLCKALQYFEIHGCILGQFLKKFL